jgi:hypothetical protein
VRLGRSHIIDAVAALKAAQGADKLYKAGDHRGQGLIAAANYRRGCAIFVRIVDGAQSCRPNAHRVVARSLSACLPCQCLPDANTDEAAKVAIRPKIAQIRGRLKKLEAALPEAAAAASREAVFREQTAAATAIQACVRGANRCPDRSHVPLRRRDVAPEMHVRVDIVLAQVVAPAGWLRSPQLQTRSVTRSRSRSRSPSPSVNPSSNPGPSHDLP